MKQRFTKRTRLVSALLTLAMVFTFLPFSAFAADGIELKDTNNFPDKRFVDNIRQYDTKTDGYLSEDELNKVTEMNLGPNTIYGLSRNIENLKGIEYFKKLKILDCSYNKITELDTSSNSDLEHLTCNRNQLTQLIVSGNNALTSLSCGNNQLTALDVSSNLNLILLSCRNNQLRSLNLSHNDKLMSLDCDNNQLTFLDLSNNVKLSDNAKLYKDMFKCSGNKYPITIDATKRTFNLNDLPTGFNVNKTSGWVGGSVNGNTLTVNKDANEVTYTYDCGNGLFADFTLVVNGGGSTGGGSTGGGSTGGGIKVSRFIILLKLTLREIRHIVHPRSVNIIKLEGQRVSDETIQGTTGYFITYVMLLFGSFILVSIDNYDFTTSITAVITTLGNVGPGLSLVGPVENFSLFSDFSKIVLSLDMLFGRLEIFPMIMLFSPSIWRKA